MNHPKLRRWTLGAVIYIYIYIYFFFSSRRRHTRSLCDWSSDVCSSDLGSVLCSDRTRLKEQLIQGLWLTQVGGREGYGVRGKPVVAEATMTLQQPETCCAFSQGSCPWITGPWQWWAAQSPMRGGVDSDLCLHTGSLVATAAALVSHACLWGPCC